jgi:FKBP-type peptidyl-prolyl cis-trans isomerase FklB
MLLGMSMLSANIYADTATGNSMSNEPAASSSKNTDAGAAFLAANAKKPGVKTLPDGLQYKVITEGKGEKPTLNDVVTVHYMGTLVDGKEFDSSYKRGEPATFPVAGVIAGWTEALQLMPAGSTWELYIPANLAYGEQGAPPVIGPNETLIFKVQLLSVKKG